MNNSFFTESLISHLMEKKGDEIESQTWILMFLSNLKRNDDFKNKYIEQLFTHFTRNYSIEILNKQLL